MATTERDVLEAKVLPELQAIASSMGVQGYFRLRKADLIGAIIAKARGEEYTPTTPSATRSRRAASTAKSASTSKAPASAAAASATPEAAPAPDAPAPDVTDRPDGEPSTTSTASAHNGNGARPDSARPDVGADEPAADTPSSSTSSSAADTPSPAADTIPSADSTAASSGSTPDPGAAASANQGEQPAPSAPAGDQPAASTDTPASQPTGDQPSGSQGDQPAASADQPAAEAQTGTAPADTGGDPSSATAEQPAERGDTSAEAEAPTRRRRRRSRSSGDDDSTNEQQLQGILSAVTSGVTPVSRGGDSSSNNGEAPAATTEPATTEPAPTAQPADTAQGDGQRDQNRDGGDRNQRRDWQQGGRWDGGASSQGGGGRRSRSRNRRNRNRFSGSDVAVADRPDYRERSGVPDDRPEVSRKGILDIRSQDGYGFLRVNGYLPGPEDVYVPLSMIRRLGLRRGDEVEAQVKLPRDNSEKYAACSRVDKVNGLEPDEARNRKDFKDLTPLYPEERLRLEHNPTEISTRIMDLMCPIGKGQRGLIVSPPKAGKTTVMKQIANAVSENNPEVHLILLLVGERPEEVTDMQRSTSAEVIYSTFDRPSEDHCQISELTIERAKRLVEYGKDVMILLDGITRLSRAYNLATPASGKILSGGVDSSALYPPKRFFGAARNVEESGSLTILATALVDTGSRMDEVIFEEFKGTGNMEVRLDRKMSERRIFPALDIDASSTRKEDLLLSSDELVVAWKLRRVLGALEPAQALEMVVDRMRASKTNAQFLQVIQRANMGN